MGRLSELQARVEAERVDPRIYSFIGGEMPGGYFGQFCINQESK